MDKHRRHDLASRTFTALLLACLFSGSGLRAADSRMLKDLEYARVGEHRLQLDLFLPDPIARPPLIVWIHGGAWRSGSKTDLPIAPLVSKGFAIASVEYRLTPVAAFPANVHDIKAALRFLRARAETYSYDSHRFVIAGASAGGHLAALVGVSNRHKELEGRVGTHLEQSSQVQAIISFFGASNLESILAQSTPDGLKVRVPALDLLLGGQPDQKPASARLASPVAHVDSQDPPLLLIHGNQDPQMPINQSHELHGAYKTHQLPVRFKVVHGGKHGGPLFYEPPMLELVASFIRTLPATR